MTNREIAEQAAVVLAFMEDREMDAARQIAVLKTAVAVIEHNVGAEAMKTMLYKALNS
jgi:hypothetical protein